SMVGVLGPPVIGLVMVLLGFLGSGVVVRSILVSTSFDAWHGILVAPAKFGPLLVGLLACAATAVLALDAARRSFRDRDFAGEGRAPASWSRLGRSVLVGGAITGVLVAGTLFDRTWITANRLQDSVGTTFRNLVVVQQGMIGHGDRTSSLRVIPFCKRSSVISGTGEGPGDDWQCQLFVNGPKLRGLSANYALTVRPNGCYTAEGPPSVIGPLHIRTQDGTVVINPLSAFDGCMIVP
ncbi:MAG TPA: hypothetical protein VNN79_21865, partial [Actinomycetota bacterium]|nr:hypothetical protein [Actinomycetota bacterium]